MESSKAPLTPGQVRQIRGIDVHECGGESGREEGGGKRCVGGLTLGKPESA